MLANELRIGNLFMGYDGKVDEVDLSLFMGLHHGYELEEIIKSFIPLTEEWLLKAGFEYAYCCYNKEGFQFSYSEGGYILDVKGYRMGKPLLHVHQLQNLFYALTGIELTFDNITPPKE